MRSTPHHRKPSGSLLGIVMFVCLGFMLATVPAGIPVAAAQNQNPPPNQIGLAGAPSSPISFQAVEHPRWQILVLIYSNTDFSYIDGTGNQQRVVASMTQEEKDRAATAATQFFGVDVPALTSGNMLPILTIRYPERTLTQLDSFCGYWPSMASTVPERDPAFDSVVVIWDSSGTDMNTGQPADLQQCGGLTPPNGTGQTYSTFQIDSVPPNHRNVFKHEWGHSILAYYEAAGTAPLPTVDNHINGTDIRYVHCPTGEEYILQDETLDNPIPNSIYNNDSGFTHDYYSGTTATPDQPTRCLGITPEAWASGGPVTKPAVESCKTGSTTWQNTAFVSQSDAFTASFDATPSTKPMDGVIGLSAGPASSYTNLAAIVRFNSQGYIDARKGGSYRASTQVPYTAGVTYRFRLAVRVSSRTYDIFVTPAGGTEKVIGTNFAFRSEQSSVTSLSNWAVYAGAGSQRVCNFAISAAPPNVLVNGGFEADSNGDTRPDNWTSNSKFTRSSTTKRSGSYAGRHRATDNSGYTISQMVNTLSAGTTYNFTGWVNIPSTSDAFTFRLEVRWINSSGSTISTSTIKSYTASTSGTWQQVTSSKTAPSGTVKAQVRMVLSSLNATIYVDDFIFRRSVAPTAANAEAPAEEMIPTDGAPTEQVIPTDEAAPVEEAAPTDESGSADTPASIIEYP